MLDRPDWMITVFPPPLNIYAFEKTTQLKAPKGKGLLRINIIFKTIAH